MDKPIQYTASATMVAEIKSASGRITLNHLDTNAQFVRLSDYDRLTARVKELEREFESAINSLEHIHGRPSPYTERLRAALRSSAATSGGDK